jgi:hypothetical protein
MGTQNHIVQLHGTFIELLGVADASGIVPHGPRFFSFGAHNRDFLSDHQGLSMLALEGQGAADAVEFRAAGIGDFQQFDFERQGRRPDGSLIKLAFTLAYAADPAAPGIGFFGCHHRYPENFWNPAFQVHANGATAVAGVVIVAQRPDKHGSFLAAFSGQHEALSSSAGLLFRTPCGDIQVMDAATFEHQFGVAPARHGRAYLAALRLAVRDRDALATLLRGADIRFGLLGERLVVGPDIALGATLAFEPAG